MADDSVRVWGRKAYQVGARHGRAAGIDFGAHAQTAMVVDRLRTIEREAVDDADFRRRVLNYLAALASVAAPLDADEFHFLTYIERRRPHGR